MLHLTPPGYLSEAEAARQLAVTVATLRTWASRRREPPRTKVGRRVLYRASALQEWLLAQERDVAAARRGGSTRGLARAA
jgi:excisionase family DNA binding protein